MQLLHLILLLLLCPAISSAQVTTEDASLKKKELIKLSSKVLDDDVTSLKGQTLLHKEP